MMMMREKKKRRKRMKRRKRRKWIKIRRGGRGWFEFALYLVVVLIFSHSFGFLLSASTISYNRVFLVEKGLSRYL